jgi:PhnB protein
MSDSMWVERRSSRRTTMAMPAQPEVRGGICPYLVLENAVAAAEFYKKAFGAEEVARMPPDDKGRFMHIHLYVNGNSLMLCDPMPEHGVGFVPHHRGVNLLLRVKGIQKAYDRAVEAGAKAIMPVAKMFWGDNYGELRDPFGVTWSMAETAQ